MLKSKLLLIVFCLSTIYSIGQNKVTGEVIDENGQLIVGANLYEQGNVANGTITDLNGKFTITIENGKTLIASMIGMQTVETLIDGQSHLKITMLSDIKDLNEVVVTALGIKREKKALGYAIEEVSSEKLNKVKTTSVAHALAGKVSGVQISESGSGMGGSTRITIRGASSLADNNKPLWVVDGIPIDNTQEYGGADQWGGSDGAGAAAQLDMENVESISVLKGASASALYGSRASNGVILVTTKKGQKGKIKVNINSNYTVDVVRDYIELQNKYGQGAAGIYSPDVRTSWGPMMTGQMVENWRDDYGDYAMNPVDQIGGFYDNGTSFTNNINISGGSEYSTFRLSVSDKHNKGITPRNTLSRQSVDLTSTLTDGKRLDITAKVNLIQEKNKNRPIHGKDGTLSNLVRMPRNIRLSDLQPAVDINGQQVLYGGATSSDKNPYFQTGYGQNKSVRHRLISMINSNYKITDDLSLGGKAGIDYYRDRIDNEAWKDYVSSASGQYKYQEVHRQEMNADIVLKYQKKVNDWNFGLNAGSAIMKRKYESLYTLVENTYIIGIQSVTNGEKIETVNDFSEKEIQSVYGFGSISYKDYAYLDFTARNDWSSTLPSDNNSYFYPSISGSFLVSEFMKETGKTLPSWMTFAKLRASIAQIGNDTQAYQTANTWEIKTTGTNGVSYADRPETFPFIDIKPEIQTSKEFGVDLRLFNNVLGIDFTTYKTNTKNQILTVTTPVISGYTSRRINAGEIENKGIELALNFKVLDKEDLKYDMTLNYGRNQNKIIELAPEYGIDKYVLENNSMLQVWAFEGGSFGDIYGRTYRRNPDNGKVLVDASGLPIINETMTKVGTVNPDWIGSMYNNLSYKNLTLTILLDGQKGGDIVNITEAEACQAGTSIRTLNRPDGGFVVDAEVVATNGDGSIKTNDNGDYLSSGNANATKVTSEKYWSFVGGRSGLTEEFVYDASYIKVREIALHYTLPASILNKTPFENAILGVTARNLGYLYRANKSLNPEGSSGSKVGHQAYTYGSLPQTASYAFNLSLTF